MATATTRAMIALTRNHAIENATLTTHHAMMMAMIAPTMLHTVLIFMLQDYAAWSERAMTRVTAAPEHEPLYSHSPLPNRPGRPPFIGEADFDRMLEGRTDLVSREDLGDFA